MLVAIFEDQTFENSYPLTLIRPIFELKCGPTMLHEKIVRALPPAKVCYFAREYLTDVLKERLPGARINELKALAAMGVVKPDYDLDAAIDEVTNRVSQLIDFE